MKKIKSTETDLSPIHNSPQNSPIQPVGNLTMKRTTSKQYSRKSDILYIVAVICLVILILFSLFPMVGGKNILEDGRKRICGHGYRNQTDGDCSCDRMHFGPQCEYRHCPVRNTAMVPCSNMVQFSILMFYLLLIKV